MKIDIDALTLDERLQPRAEMDDDLVQRYTDDMKNGDVFPPIRVIGEWLVDGWHRVSAAKRAGIKQLPAVMTPGTFEAAEDFTFTVNRTHGLQRTHADVQAAIRRALLTARWVERSDEWIAEVVGCANQTVGRKREALEATLEILRLEKLLGKDGRWRPREINRTTYTLAQWAELKPAAQARILKNGAHANESGGFNKQDTDNIEWARWSWNPVTGCKHNCPYCYARDIATRFSGTAAFPVGFEPVLHPRRLAAPQHVNVPADAETDLGYGNVFVCSMAYLFGRWVPENWIEAVLTAVRNAPQWNFLFLTKFPIRLAAFEFPDNAWIGTTVDCQARVVNAESAFAKVRAKVKWLSCEPLIEPLRFRDLSQFQWIVIGGASPSAQTPTWRPPRQWVDDLSEAAWTAGCQVYEKDNLLRRWRQYPGHDDDPPMAAPDPFHYLSRATTPDEQVEAQKAKKAG